MKSLKSNVDAYQSRFRSRHVTSAHMVGDKVVTVDVREDLAKGREPFGRIMHAVERLEDDESLLLIAPFQPAPLFSLMAAEGFSHQTRETASGDWEVLFSRTRETKLTSASSRACSQSPIPLSRRTRLQSKLLEIDTRGCEPPQPLVMIVEALNELSDGTGIRAYTDRRPMHLYPVLAERGFRGETEPQADGSFVTIIRRA